MNKRKYKKYHKQYTEMRTYLHESKDLNLIIKAFLFPEMLRSGRYAAMIRSIVHQIGVYRYPYKDSYDVLLDWDLNERGGWITRGASRTTLKIKLVYDNEVYSKMMGCPVANTFIFYYNLDTRYREYANELGFSPEWVFSNIKENPITGIERLARSYGVFEDTLELPETFDSPLQS